MAFLRINGRHRAIERELQRIVVERDVAVREHDEARQQRDEIRQRLLRWIQMHGTSCSITSAHRGLIDLACVGQ